ncbi:hypothetical protein HPB51_024429 [Rhipicephalus microplus]|uniref:Uncharacterized protein n=1 Tax=Rhipicephalus microplus TaxID=6941 RepID=A0A9J6D7I7_RHIMP|nr:hypothetical protein HPB51_024429 [Rhipicephalus microplus]
MRTDCDDARVVCFAADDWVRATDGHVPKNALVAGHNLHGESFYVGRVMLRGNLLPGKVLPSSKVCFVSLEQMEFSSNVYEVLVKAPSVNYQWVSSVKPPTNDSSSTTEKKKKPRDKERPSRGLISWMSHHLSVPTGKQL